MLMRAVELYEPLEKTREFCGIITSIVSNITSTQFREDLLDFLKLYTQNIQNSDTHRRDRLQSEESQNEHGPE